MDPTKRFLIHNNQSQNGLRVLDKVQNFKIRIKIIEARQLVGTNINPICRLKFAKITKETKTVNLSNNPFWNQAFFIDVKMSLSDLCENKIEFEVLNSRELRTDSSLGVFQIDLADIYEKEYHSLIRKWLSLGETNNNHESDTKGYLKVSISILGPNDQIPV